MKRSIFAIMSLLSLACTCAEPEAYTALCAACRGKRSLSITPPNLGQYDGEIGVLPGRPFNNHRFDVKYEHCPLCGGTGKHEMYKTKVKPPESPDPKLDPCPDCRWSCVMQCKKCTGTGYQQCPSCSHSTYSSNKGGKPGWVVTQKASSSFSRHNSKRYQKTLVTPCPKCSGVGKIICPDCTGHGALPCRKCRGVGGIPKKEVR